MSVVTNKNNIFMLLILSTIICASILNLTACSTAEFVVTSTSSPLNSLRDNSPKVLIPVPSNITTFDSPVFSIDASNSSRGYIMVNYTGNNEKVKLQFTTPEGITYTYLITDYNKWTTYPLPGGGGFYKIDLYELADSANELYVTSFTTSIEVFLEDDFLPFLYPNNYVHFTPESLVTEKGKELSEVCSSDLEAVSNIYHFVIKNITYDVEKAETVTYGYVPSPDETLITKKGICFDYASLITAMLRSQGIPTKLEVGYAGSTYHAWISCYIDDIGWIDNIIQFDGKSWTLMDPTFAANDNSKVNDFIGSGTNYQVKYSY